MPRKVDSFSVAASLFNNTAASPLYYVRGGRVHLNTGSLRYAGYASYYWSATTYPSATNAYYLDFSSTNVNPSYYSTRFYGFSVRCIAPFSRFFLFLPSPSF